MNIKERTLQISIIIFSIIGALFSGYLWYQHNALIEQREGALLIPCTIGDSFNCDVVNTSSYSELFGVPIAVFGLLSYLIVGLIGVMLLFNNKKIINNKKNIWLFLSLITGLMSLYGIYLFYVSSFLIGAYCIFCIVTYLCSFGLFFCSYLGWKELIEKTK